MGLNEAEVEFYDALAANENAVRKLGDPVLSQMAQELVAAVRHNTTIDWTVKQSARAQMRGHHQASAVPVQVPARRTGRNDEIVLRQAELFGEEWVA